MTAVAGSTQRKTSEDENEGEDEDDRDLWPIPRCIGKPSPVSELELPVPPYACEAANIGSGGGKNPTGHLPDHGDAIGSRGMCRD